MSAAACSAGTLLTVVIAVFVVLLLVVLAGCTWDGIVCVEHSTWSTCASASAIATFSLTWRDRVVVTV